jgi:hypothetical protein
LDELDLVGLLSQGVAENATLCTSDPSHCEDGGKAALLIILEHSIGESKNLDSLRGESVVSPTIGLKI